MNAARTLKRVLAIGLAITALTIGGVAVPAPTASAAILPDAHVGAPDAGYPCGIRSCAEYAPASPPVSGDVGYPGCPSGCMQNDLKPASSGDVGYPNCQSGCEPQTQPANAPPDDATLI